MDEIDESNGYEAVAKGFIAGRGTHGTIGVNAVRRWARTLPPGGSVLDLGCGCGVPISQVLMVSGLSVYGVDASATMMAAFHARFPDVPAECSRVGTSRFFSRTFDGVIAWGLMFLLAPDVQALVIHKAAGVLNSGGRFLFTSPAQVTEWPDGLTGQKSISLGVERYAQLLQAEGLVLVEQREDEGDNHYYWSVKSH